MITYFKEMLDTITDSILSLNEEAFRNLVNESVYTLEQGKKIIVSGLGKNVPVCEKFVGTMISMGQNAGYMNTNSAVHGDIGMVSSGDLVIILTKSGETSESVYLANLLEKREANLWLLSFEHNSTLDKKIKKSIILSLKHEGDLWNIVPNNSTTVNLIILQGLAMMITRKRNVLLNDFKRNHPGGHIGVKLENV
ncbi:MAG: SIS domain-containing protein [Clostridium sp.]|nr:SIS domain-containing protein [Clostridium sp.]